MAIHLSMHLPEGEPDRRSHHVQGMTSMRKHPDQRAEHIMQVEASRSPSVRRPMKGLPSAQKLP